MVLWRSRQPGKKHGCLSNRKASGSKEAEQPYEALRRRFFFFGALLAGPFPKGGFGSVPSLKGRDTNYGPNDA